MNEVDEPARCLDNPEFYKFPGQKVSRADLCLGSKVIDGFCRGKPNGEKCEHHIECDIGLRCGLELMCEPAGEEYGRCDKDYILSNSYLYCQEGACIRYGTVADGHPAGRGGADLCKSRYMNDHGVCDTAPKLRGPIYVDSPENLCVYDNKEENRAVCGYHKDGKAICKPGAADLNPLWQNVSRQPNE